MNVKQELNNLLVDINVQIRTIIEQAAMQNKHLMPAERPSAMQMRDSQGNYVLVPLLLAKAQVLAALANLKE